MPMKIFFTFTFVLLCSNVFAQDTTFSSMEEEPIYNVSDVEPIPQFPGGDQKLFKFLTETLKYPSYAMDEGIEGKLYLTFIVEKDGTLSDVKIAEGPNESLIKEALR